MERDLRLGPSGTSWTLVAKWSPQRRYSSSIDSPPGSRLSFSDQTLAAHIGGGSDGGRVPFITCAHGHDDHIDAAVELFNLIGALCCCTPTTATGRSYSDFPTILDSIRARLLALPGETDLTGRGDEITIGPEATAYDDWVLRGH